MGVRAPRRCLPAPLPHHLPCKPLLFFMPVTCNVERRSTAGGAHGPEGCTRRLRASTHRNTTPALPPAPSRALISHQSTTPDGIGAKLHTQGMGGDTSLPAGAPFAEPPPPVARAGTALFSPDCPVLQQHAFTLICLYQKRRNHPRCTCMNLWARVLACLPISPTHLPTQR